MSDAPERIWVAGTPSSYGNYYESCVEAEGAWGGVGVEYVRADLPPTLAAEMALPKVAALVHALVVWDAAFRTGKNEPLHLAFELGAAALAQIRGK